MEQNSMTTAIGAHGSYEGDKRGITGLTLKLIAVITMLIDHTAATILERAIVNNPWNWSIEEIHNWYNFYGILRGIGRMAFPIYIYLLIEGYTHTRSVAKYVRNMAIFVVLSEVPFDMAFQESFVDWSYNSVFVTLLIGLCTLVALDWVDKHLVFVNPSILKNFFKSFVLIFIILGMMVLADFLKTDYGAAGVAAIALMYILRNHRLVGFTASVVILGCMASNIEFLALFMLIPIYFYNGKRGPSNAFLKYFFYAFYPVHLLILSLICYGLGLGI